MAFQQAAAVVSINTLQTGASHLIIAKLGWGGQFTSRKSTQKNRFICLGLILISSNWDLLSYNNRSDYQDAAEGDNTRPVSLQKWSQACF